MATQTQLMTSEAFIRYAEAHPDQRLELIHGRIVEKVGNDLHGWIILQIGHLLKLWIDERGIQATAQVETHSRIDETNVRVPDVQVKFEDPATLTEAYGQHAPDFAVEVKSPTNTDAALSEKAAFYLANGTQLVWIVYPGPRFVEVFWADGRTSVHKVGERLDGGDVLPGFAPHVVQLFPPLKDSKAK